MISKTLLAYIPETWRGKLLSDWQCRAIGITQSPGW